MDSGTTDKRRRSPAGVALNTVAVQWILARVLLLLAGFMLIPAGVSAYFAAGLDPEGTLYLNEVRALQGCLIGSLVTAIVAGVLMLKTRNRGRGVSMRPDFFRREGLATVGFSWLLAALFGAIPFIASGTIASPVDAFFESTSGFTTTGATILGSATLDGLPTGIAFWRSFTHWLGGIGIVLVFVLIFPSGGRSLFRSEVPGVSREAAMQRVKDSALGLVRIYVGLTAIEVLLLKICGMNWFDSLIHGFGTLATGGFSNHSHSVLWFGSWRVEMVLVGFMFLAGINFALYDLLLRKGFRHAWGVAARSTELRVYVGLICGSVLVIALTLWFWGGSNGDPTQGDLPDYSSLSLALRDSVFTVVSMQTSTGYATANFDRWPQFCRILLMMLAFCGACAGSTGGGLKVVRFLILAKASLQGVRRFARPRAIHPVRMDGNTVDDGMVVSVTGYCGLWLVIFIAGTLAITAMGVTPPEGMEDQVLLTVATSVLATLNNIGPGLAAVGPYENFAFMPPLAKILLSLFMILGRLEFYALVVLFVPRFWRQ